MRIDSIEIDNFGAWTDLSLALKSDGMNVFYGPNEAGKSTLLRFIRGSLFGFDATDDRTRKLAVHGDSRDASSRSSQGGRLSVRHDGEAWQIGRTTGANGNQFSVQSRGESIPVEQEELTEFLLNGASREVFDNVFAFGLHELQRLSTLEDEQIAEHIYNLSLGPDARRLFDASASSDTESASIFDPVAETGDLASLFQQQRRVAKEIESIGDIRDRFEKLDGKRQRLESSIADMKQRQNGIHSEIRGHEFMAAVWEPWRNVEELRQERDQLPSVDGLSMDSIAVLDELESEIESTIRCRDAVVAERNVARQEYKRLQLNKDVSNNARKMRFLIDQGESLDETSHEIERLQAEYDRLEAQVRQHSTQLGPNWTLEAVGKVDTSPSAQLGLVRASLKYRMAISRRSRLSRKIKRLEDSARRRDDQLTEQLEQMGLEADGIEDAMLEVQMSIESMGPDAEHSGHIVALQQKIAHAHSELEHNSNREELPVWLDKVIAGFGVIGILLAISGAVTGVQVSVVAGLIFGMLGATWFGLGWALNTHFQDFDSQRTSRLNRQIEAWTAELHSVLHRDVPTESTQLALHADADSQPVNGLQLTNEVDKADDSAGDETQLEDLICTLVELEGLLRRRDAIRRRKRRVSELRTNRRPKVQNEYRTALNGWCQALRQIGLPESDKIIEPLEVWERVAEVALGVTKLRELERHLERARAPYESLRRRIEQLARTLGGGKKRNKKKDRQQQRHNIQPVAPKATLAVWQNELDDMKSMRSERRQIRQEDRERRREAGKYQKTLDDLKLRRQRLLSQAGADSREELDQRLEWVQKRNEFDVLIAEANEELAVIASAEPELAIVEEDLREFDQQRNSEHLEMLSLELSELKKDVEKRYEELGSLKQQARELESSTRQTELLHQNEQLASRIRETAAKWFGTKLAGKAVDQIRDRFEQSNQPPTLAVASEYLERLTEGHFRRVWTPLTEQRLFVTDDQNRNFTVEQLSRGTREQLFLAIRFALVQMFSQQGHQIPLVLDDVFVNFDQARTEAAAGTLVDMANGGQQILFFTCHQHLAEIFERLSVEPIWLPDHRASFENRRAG